MYDHAQAADMLGKRMEQLRLLRHLASRAQSHVAWGQAGLESLPQSAEEPKRALEVQADIEARLVA